jgi:hypothetical protein
MYSGKIAVPPGGGGIVNNNNNNKNEWNLNICIDYVPFSSFAGHKQQYP